MRFKTIIIIFFIFFDLISSEKQSSNPTIHTTVNFHYKKKLTDYNNYKKNVVKLEPEETGLPLINKNQNLNGKLNDRLIIKSLRGINNPDIHITTHITN